MTGQTDSRSFASWSRSRYLLSLLLTYLLLCLFQRIVYSGWIFAENHSFPAGFLLACLKGLCFDLGSASFLFLPLTLLLGLLPERWASSKSGRGLTLFFSIAPLLLAILSSACELFFWEEFHARYNFIAVDYLVYTHEVIRNIWESYPVVWFLLAVSAVVAFSAWRLRLRVRKMVAQVLPWKERGALLGMLAVMLTLGLTLSEDRWLASEESWARELSKNSLFALFSAYNRNSIEYTQFYVSLDPKEAKLRTHAWLAEKGNAGSMEENLSLAREIKPGKEQKEWNVVLVAIESMSARFLSHYGNDKIITPNLDRMAAEGIFFNKLYATGSRTVRGLEALMLSLPPTPGQSILRRPNSDHLFNLGTVFASHKYRTQFIYGGIAFFDNMREWFSSNGFEIIDKPLFAPGGVHFANAWGACDEDLFDEVIRRADEAESKKEHFFQVVLTTSNHRPYTYPDGRIDIPSHSGRDGAVKYTDYAIGRFVKLAQEHSWYKNTLFIFVADHNASVAGGTELPIRDYLIPVIFHNPNLVKPQVVDKLSSQIDIGPSLLGLLGFGYKSWFFGQDLFSAKAGRALLGTYQNVALLEPGQLTILEPGRRALIQELGPLGEVKHSQKISVNLGSAPEDPVARAAAIYQAASELFGEGMSKVPLPQ